MQFVEPEKVIQTQATIRAGASRRIAQVVLPSDVRGGCEVLRGVVEHLGHQAVDVEDGE